jgi:hypothetical protein
LKTLIVVTLSLMSFFTWADSNKYHNNAPSIFDVIPLNSPVKVSTAKFLLKVPNGFDIDEVRYRVRNASRLFEKDQPHQKINLIDGPQGKELHISVSKLPPGFYQLFVKVRDRKNKEHEFKTKFKDHAMFAVDSSLQVPLPNPKINDKTVAGVDSDGDGIRDDIQRWINEDFSSQPKIKMAVKQMAMGMQLDLLSATDKALSLVTSRKVLSDMDCLNFIVGIDEQIKIRKELESKMLNTKERHYAEIKSNANFSGQSFTVPIAEEDQKSLCSFNPDNF